MSNLALATPPDDDLSSSIELQPPRSYGSDWQHSMGSQRYYNAEPQWMHDRAMEQYGSPDTSDVGTIAPLDDQDDFSTQAAFNSGDRAKTPESLGLFSEPVDWQALATQMDATGDTSWEDDFIMRSEDEAWDGMAIDCPGGVCLLSGDDLAFLDAVGDGGVA